MRLAISYLLGLSLLTLLMFGTNLLGLPLNTTNSLLLFALTIIPLIILYPHLPSTPKISTSPSKLNKILKGIILVLSLVVLLNDSYRIVGEWDSLTLYDFRARRIVETGSIAKAAEIQGSYFYSYPLFTSLFHSFTYLLGFSSPMLIYGLIFISFLTIFYSLLRTHANEFLSLLGTILLIFAPHLFWHAQIAYTNLAYATYLSLGALFLLEWKDNKSTIFAILGMFFTGTSVWVRSTEPFWLGNLLLFLVIGVSNFRFKDIFYGLLFFYPLQQLWKRYVAAMFHNVESTVSQIQGSVATVATAAIQPTFLQLLSDTIVFFTHSIVRPYAPVLLLFAISLLMQLTKRRLSLFLISLIIFDLLVSFIGTYVFAITQSYWREIPGSLERMMMFISPLIIYVFIITIDSTKKNYGQ